MPFDVQRALVDDLAWSPGAFVSLDPYRLLPADSVGDWREVVAQVDALFLSEDELEVGSRDEPRAALRSLASGRLRFVLFKRGASAAPAAGSCTTRARTDSWSGPPAPPPSSIRPAPATPSPPASW